MKSNAWFSAGLLIAVAIIVLGIRAVHNDYAFFAAYAVLQYIALASAWNILGGYAGYVNFGTAAFFALGAYTSVVIGKLAPVPIPLMMLAAGVVSGLVGALMGLMTLKLRGVFFGICTLALAVVAQAAITNWDFVGGSAGAYVVPPASDRSADPTSNICSSSCWRSLPSPSPWRAASSGPASAAASPPFATTNSPPRAWVSPPFASS